MLNADARHGTINANVPISAFVPTLTLALNVSESSSPPLRASSVLSLSRHVIVRFAGWARWLLLRLSFGETGKFCGITQKLLELIRYQNKKANKFRSAVTLDVGLLICTERMDFFNSFCY